MHQVKTHTRKDQKKKEKGRPSQQEHQEGKYQLEEVYHHVP